MQLDKVSLIYQPKNSKILEKNSANSATVHLINIHYFFTVESKQVAQQEAQRAAFVVDRAIQERQQKIVQAEGEAQAAAMLGESLGKNPGYLKLRKLNASKHIAKTVSEKFEYLINDYMYTRRQ